MPIDRLERGEQALPPLAVERTDRTAQPVDRQPQFLALGGIAEARGFEVGQLALGDEVDRTDPLEAGLEIMAQPPGKKLQSLTLLSGGEQALTAVALIFGLFLTNPAPICVLDEVDAPLDDANIERFCGLLDAMTRETQTRYLIVTHNAVTMSRMHRLFGVTMVEQGVSRLVSVDLGGAETLLAAE
jgi:chromosome segregation protein